MRRFGNGRESQVAFTLVEVLIAVAITALIVVLLGQMFSAAAKMWTTADQRIDAFRDARATLQLMSSDLGRANINGDQKMLTLNQVSADGSYASEADAITPASNKGKSDLCTVQYYLLWNGTTKTYSLMRRLKDSDATSGFLQNKTLDYTTIYDKKTGTEETLATPAWDLEIKPGEIDNVVTPATDNAAKWRWLEIKFKTMSVNAATKIKTAPGVVQATWADPTSSAYKTFILPYEQQFITRVSLDQNR
jgi:type II secretory pathway component PulJ